MNDKVDAVDAGLAVDEMQNDLPGAPAPEQAPVPAVNMNLKLFVSYVGSNGHGQVFGSTILSGIADLLCEQDVHNIQAAIAKAAGYQAVAILCTKHLYA